VKRNGFTLLEAMIGLGLFLAVVIPLLSIIDTANRRQNSRDEFTALCLLEQECALVQNDPKGAKQTRKRVANGKEWTVSVKCRGTGLVTCSMTIATAGKNYASATFYVYAQP
jgi:Tfp pilus assembly protein PilV